MGTNVALLTGGQGINNVQSTGDQFRYQGVDPDEALEQQALNRRQQIANLLIQQGLAGSGTGQMVGRFYVPPSPVQGLADLAKVGVGAYGSYKNDEARGELATKNQQALMEAVAKWKKDSADRVVTTELEGPGAPMGQAPSPQPPQESATDTLSRLLPASGPAATGPMPQAIPNDGRSPTGFTQNFNPNTGGPLTPPATPPIPSWGNMSEMSGQAMAQPPQPTVQQPGVTEGPRPTRTTTVPRTPEERRQALADLMVSGHPLARQLASFQANQEERMENRALLHEEKQAALTSNAEQKKLLTDIQQKQFEMTYQNSSRQLDQQYEANKDRLANSSLDREARARIEADNNRIDRERLALDRSKTEQGKVPPGYEKVEGGLHAIPGGPADTKLQGVLNSDTLMLQNSNAGFDRLASTANQLLNHPGLPGITGVRGKVPDIPGTDAANARALLETLKSQIGFGVMQEMRNNAKSGSSGLGALSDAEGKRLENNLAALDTAQGLDQFKAQLKNGVVDYATGAKDRLRDGFNMKHKQGEPAAGKPSTAVPTTKGKPNAFQPFHDPDEEKAYQQWKLEHK